MFPVFIKVLLSYLCLGSCSCVRLALLGNLDDQRSPRRNNAIKSNSGLERFNTEAVLRRVFGQGALQLRYFGPLKTEVFLPKHPAVFTTSFKRANSSMISLDSCWTAHKYCWVMKCPKNVQADWITDLVWKEDDKLGISLQVKSYVMKRLL